MEEAYQKDIIKNEIQALELPFQITERQDLIQKKILIVDDE